MAEPVLRMQDLARHFGGLKALEEVSLEVPEGQRRGIIGPNGAGKTTLFNVITGEMQPTRGKVFLRGQEITGLRPEQIVKRGLSRTFQRTNLFPGLTALENVRLALQEREGVSPVLWRSVESFPQLRAEAVELLSSFGLQHLAGEPVRHLSYGDQRQLEMVMALALSPSVLLLDEPTAGLSVAETASMVSMIRSLPGHITLLIIEHDMDVIFSLVSHLTVLHYGRVLADGPAEEVQGNERVLEVYLGVGEDG